MAISFDKALGIHQQAVAVRERRAEVLANNLANADTPGFKARDIDFRAVLNAEQGDSALAVTNSKHMATFGAGAGDLMFRMPLQPSLDGNTVEEQVELSQFAKNALDFQFSSQMLSNKFKGLSGAIRGDQ